LIGGPDASDNYVDARSNYQQNEPALDYNAGFQSAVAGLLKLAVQGIVP
jgi:endoglucanase